MTDKCPWCQVQHPVEELCRSNRGLSRRSFLMLSSMAAVGAMTRWMPMPLEKPFVPGSLVVRIEVDITRFVKQIELFEEKIRKLTRVTEREMHAIINLHTQLTKTQEGNVFELSCDPEWRECDESLPVLQHPHGASAVIKT